MAVRDILLFPDPGLKLVCAEASVDDAGRALLQDLSDTLYASPGVGLAAPQIGVPLRAVAVDVTRKPPSGRPPAKGHGLVLLLNPRVVKAEGEKKFREGCLSIPDFLADVRRAAWVRVEGRDGEGREQAVEADGLEAVCLQHEIDHLDGILFLDRVADLKTGLFRRKKPDFPKPAGDASLASA
jgi:peptide deformylase